MHAETDDGSKSCCEGVEIKACAAAVPTKTVFTPVSKV